MTGWDPIKEVGGEYREWYRFHDSTQAPLKQGERVHVAGIVTPSSLDRYVNGRKVNSIPQHHELIPHTYTV